MRLPLCTVGELGEMVLCESFWWEEPGVSIGDGYTCKFSGDGDITSPERS
jgi:hypothetical protein